MKTTIDNAEIEKLVNETNKKIDVLCGHESGISGQAALDLITKKLKLVLYRISLEKALENNKWSAEKYKTYIKSSYESLKKEINETSEHLKTIIQNNESLVSINIRFAGVIRKMLIFQGQESNDQNTIA